MSVNKVILMGHTGKAPDFREFDNGGCVATFSLATTKRGYTTKDGRRCCRYHLRANPKRPANWIYPLPGTRRRNRGTRK